MPGISTPWWCSAEKWPRNARIVTIPSRIRPIVTCAPCRPVSEKKTVACALSWGAKPMWTYSLIWMNRNVRPSRKVAVMPACRPKRLPFLIDVCAQCSVSDDETRIAVLTPATATGRSLPSIGNHPPGSATIRMKKYAVKKAPKTITSEMMNNNIPSSAGSTRELRFAGGGPWWSWPCAAAIEAASMVLLRLLRGVGGGAVRRFDVLDRLVGDLAHAVDQVRAQPSGAR